jgi:hypothetical protein
MWEVEALFQLETLPWSQLRCLTLICTPLNARLTTRLFQQLPALESLELDTDWDDYFQSMNISLHYLRRLSFTVRMDLFDFERLLQAFHFPNLQELQIRKLESLTPKVYSTIRGQYHLGSLEEIDFDSGYHLPVSLILKDAPRLRRIALQSDVILDREAIEGLSTGTLGRCLKSLKLGGVECNVDEILSMLHQENPDLVIWNKDL